MNWLGVETILLVGERESEFDEYIDCLARLYQLADKLGVDTALFRHAQAAITNDTPVYLRTSPSFVDLSKVITPAYRAWLAVQTTWRKQPIGLIYPGNEGNADLQRALLKLADDSEKDGIYMLAYIETPVAATEPIKYREDLKVYGQ